MELHDNSNTANHRSSSSSSNTHDHDKSSAGMRGGTGSSNLSHGKGKMGIGTASGSVQTRYSFYQTENPIELAINPASRDSMEILTETTSVDTQNLKESPRATDQHPKKSVAATNDISKTSPIEEVLRSLSEAQIDAPGDTSSVHGKNDTERNPSALLSLSKQGDNSNVSESSSVAAGKPPIHVPQGNHSAVDPNAGKNAYERAIRDALGYIRKRRQQRMALLAAHHSGGGIAGVSGASSSGAGEEGNRRWTNASSSAGLSSVPLSPEGIDDGSTALANATVLEDRLLSPPADVRKAALEEMFRHYDVHGSGTMSDKDGEDVTKPFKGLELAHPVNSSYGRDSPVINVAMGDKGDGSSATQYCTVPSSPAPGKSHMIEKYESLKDLETHQSRRKALEMERRARTELDIEKGVERVLLAILQLESNPHPEHTMEIVLQSLLNEQELSATTMTAVSSVAAENSHPQDNLSTVNEDQEKEQSMESSLGDVGGFVHSPALTNNNDVAILEQIESEEDDVSDFDSMTHTHNSYDDAGSDDDKDAAKDEMVLGPLSSKVGGTTGVVLQDRGESSDDEDDFDRGEGDSVSDYGSPSDKKNASPSIISAVTSAVRKSSDAIATKLSFGKAEKGLDRNEALVRSLYSHKMVRHPSRKSNSRDVFSKWLSDKFKDAVKYGPKVEWDDDDPDEPGYIVHTFTKAKLQEIEHMYENMMERMQTEYTSTVNSSNNRQGLVDSEFERDLEEAEKLLDSRTKKSPSKSSKSSKKNDKEDKSSLSKLSPDTTPTDPTFPAAKTAGTGNIGDLEIYHLPIIYKAHQTGFEPTKDLVLQPDSIFAGQYYVQSELGSAAFSTAYRCVDLTSGKKAEDGEVYYDEVCLKVIKNTKDFFDQSLDEIKILELLRQTGQCHENNILEMKAFFYHKEHLIIVTELLRQNLFEFGKYIMEHNEPQYFTRSRLCYIARQCLVALRFVHKLGLVHSDIKPENILLASYSRARVKVIDFGSSCYLTDRQSSYIQSRSYRAPEVILGLPYDGKIDVWSLGCVIAEMYTGQVTFQNDSVVSMLARIEAICGAFPSHMIDEGRQSGQFFTPTGLLYEKMDSESDSGVHMNTSASFQDSESDTDYDTLFNILQPKTTTMAERLGFDANLMTSKRKTWEEDEKALFTDFVTKLLTIDPQKRPSAEEALEHPWILSGFNLTEEDLKYPPDE